MLALLIADMVLLRWLPSIASSHALAHAAHVPSHYCHQQEVPYDIAVLATGSFPFVPPTPGIDKPGVFVYRTLDDLEAMIKYQKDHGVTKAAVIGGGLLGLEAAKAMSDLGCETHVMEYAPILMCRQVSRLFY